MLRINRILMIFLLCGIAVPGCSSLANQPDGTPGWSFSQLLGNNPNSRSDDATLEDLDSFGERNPDRITWSDLSPDRIGTTIQAKLQGSYNPDLAQDSFREGQELYESALSQWNNGNRSQQVSDAFRLASQKFEIAAGNWEDSDLEQDALFLQGESSFFADDYMLANRAYEILLSKYSGTPHLDLVEARRYEIALYWLKLARAGQGMTFGNHSRPNIQLQGAARRILHRIRLDDPTGKLADDATLALGNAFMEAKRYADAADAYEDLRKTFPGSPHQYQAHLLELQARLAAYRGPNYDGTDLEKAEKLLKTMIQQFPDKVESEREFLAAEGGKIRELLAERDWTLANYYEGRGENRAATFYYQRVASAFDDTSLATSATERIAALTGLPAVPPQRAEFLTRMFPLKERNKPLLNIGNSETVLR